MKIKSFDSTEWVSIGTAAALADVSKSWARAKAKSGEWRAFEIEGIWYVHRKDAESFVRHPNFGRPRKAGR